MKVRIQRGYIDRQRPGGFSTPKAAQMAAGRFGTQALPAPEAFGTVFIGPEQ